MTYKKANVIRLLRAPVTELSHDGWLVKPLMILLLIHCAAHVAKVCSLYIRNVGLLHQRWHCVTLSLCSVLQPGVTVVAVVVVWHSGRILVSISVVTLCRAQQPLRPTQFGHPSVGRKNKYCWWSQPWLGKKWQSRSWTSTAGILTTNFLFVALYQQHFVCCTIKPCTTTYHYHHTT